MCGANSVMEWDDFKKALGKGHLILFLYDNHNILVARVSASAAPIPIMFRAERKVSLQYPFHHQILVKGNCILRGFSVSRVTFIKFINEFQMGFSLFHQGG